MLAKIIVQTVEPSFLIRVDYEMLLAFLSRFFHDEAVTLTFFVVVRWGKYLIFACGSIHHKIADWSHLVFLWVDIRDSSADSASENVRIPFLDFFLKWGYSCNKCSFMHNMMSFTLMQRF